MDLNVFRNRRGELVPLITIACLGFVELSTRQIFLDENYYQREHWPIPLGLFLSAAVFQTLTRGRAAQAIEPREWLVSSSSDPAQGGMIHKPSAHKWKFFRECDKFFLLPVRFWPWVLCGLGILT
jgi:hypothetical protein